MDTLRIHPVTSSDTADHIEPLLDRFEEGETEPMVIRRGDAPAAAVIPFTDYIELLRHRGESQAKEEAFRNEMQHRIDTTDDDAEQFSGVEDFFASLGSSGEEFLARKRQKEDAHG